MLARKHEGALRPIVLIEAAYVCVCVVCVFVPMCTCLLCSTRIEGDSVEMVFVNSSSGGLNEGEWRKIGDLV